MRARRLTRAATVLVLGAALVLTTVGMANAGVSRAWTHQFGRDGQDYATDVAVDGDRNIYVVGRIRTDRGDDCFVRKYRPDGSRRWMRIVGTATGDYCRGVAVARNGSIYLVGYTYGTVGGRRIGSADAFVRKYRPDGSVAWTRQFGTTAADQAAAVAVDDAGNVIVVGHTLGAFGGTTSRGGWDGFLRKFRADGRHVWTRQFGTVADEFVSDVAVNSMRQVVTIGQTFSTLGGPYRGDGDAFVRALRPNGNHYWTRQFGTSQEDWAFGVAVADNDRIYVVGDTWGALPGQTSSGETDGYIRKLRPDGSAAWTRQFGGPSYDSAEDVTVDRFGKVYVAGRIYVASYDAMLMKVRADGTRAWVRKAGASTVRDEGRGVAVDRKKHVYLVGMSDGVFGGQTWSGSQDAWIRKYKP